MRTKDNTAGAERDLLNQLQVIDRLEVGPVRVEKSRILTEYSVLQNGHRDSYQLIYRFEENVFSPDSPASLNLASVMTAQLALNYGLFCDEICFHGPFDNHDQRFIQEMARNTAREIFVKKFLEPNPFLQGPAAELPPIRRDTYLRANCQVVNFFGDLPNFLNGCLKTLICSTINRRYTYWKLT